MKNKRIIKETINKDQAIAQFKTMSDSEKIGWIKAIRECINELGYGSISKSDIALTTFGVGLIVIGVKLKIPELCVMGAAGIGAMAHFEKDVWVKIINCAKNKRKETDEIPDGQIMETKMKKVIRLTENDLTKIVKRVIKEQSEETNFIKSIQTFLNEKIKAGLQVDGKTGPNSETEKAIQKYQRIINCYPNDGVWGPNTWEKMSLPDKKRLKDIIASMGGPIDRFLHWIGLD